MACRAAASPGAGTLQPIAKSTATVNAYKNQAAEKNALDSKYEIALPLLLED